MLEAGLAWCLAFIALIVGGAILLGATGGFGAVGFLLSHAVATAVLLGIRRKSLRADGAAAASLLRSFRAYWNGRGPDRLAAAAVGILGVLLTAIAAWAEPAVADALTYHLPRVGHWLQEGRIGMIPTADERMNFVACVPELVMAWLLGGTSERFRPVVLAQVMGGWMTLGATVGLARETGLSRTASLLSALLLAGMANVIVQFTAAQTDLFTTGVFSAAFFLWLRALRRGEVSLLGAGGAGLALGAKGTLFYLAPGAALWVAWLAWQHRLSSRRWLATFAIAALGIACFAGPGFFRNWRAYGNALGPEKWVTKHHQGFDSPRTLLRKLDWNLTAALAQNVEPQSQPWPGQTAARAMATRLSRSLPEHDPFTLDGTSRHEVLDTLIARARPDADAVSFGGVALALFALGTLAALLRWRTPGARVVQVWSAGVAAFVVFFHGMQQWHPFGFRYLVLAAPWIAVVAGWGIEALPRLARAAVWMLAVAAAADVAWCVTTRTHQAGWLTVVHPERSTDFYVAQAWREWSRQLDRPEDSFVVAVNDTRPVAAFYRQLPRREVTFAEISSAANASAEELAAQHAGWVIVPAARFVGREGNVMASVWLFRGDVDNPYSVAAYRRVQPGENPPLVLYRNIATRARDERHRELVVKTWSGAPVRFAIRNADEFEWRFVVVTPDGCNEGRSHANATTTVAVPLAAGEVSRVLFRFIAPAGRPVEDSGPTVELAAP